jgi:hypothetical protein
MHVVVNHLHFGEPPPQAALDALDGDVGAAARAIPGFVSAHLAEVDEHHYLMLVVGETAEALQRISAEVGGPWVQEHLAPHFAAPP